MFSVDFCDVCIIRYVFIILNDDRVTEWPLIGKQLLTRPTLCQYLIVNLVSSQFGL